MHLICFLILLTLISAQIEGINQIINGKFTNPGLPPGQIERLYPKDIEGWSCTAFCQIQNCTETQMGYPTINGTGLDCSGYVIDINSRCINEELTQVINLSVNNYWLSIDYIYPRQSANQKQMQVIFNEDIIFSLVPNVTVSIERHRFYKKIEAKDGINVLRIRNSGLNDCYGFKIANISLNRQFNSILQGTVNKLFELQVLKKSKAVPGTRIFFYSLLDFMVNFDRLEFYIYHNRQYSKNSLNLFQKIKSLQSAKGNFIQSEIRHYLPSFANCLDFFFTQSQIKKEYINYNVGDEDQKHYNLPYYIHSSLTFSVPIVFSLFILLHMSFRLLQKWNISVIFRPYAFYATLIFALLEGNIESLTFYSFKELQTLCSFNFQHKLLNLLSLIVLFFVLFFCSGLCLFLKFHYQNKVKLVIDSEKSTFPSIVSTSFDRGMILFILGATHQLLLPSPNLQMFVLISIELLWILEKIIMRASFIHSLFFLISLMESLLRICLQITCLIYSHYQELRLEINCQYHFYLIFGFIGIVTINFVCNFIFLLKYFIVRHIFPKNSLWNNKQMKKQKLDDQEFNIVIKSHNLSSNKQSFQLRKKKPNEKEKEKENFKEINKFLARMMIQGQNKNKIQMRSLKKSKKIMFQVVFVNKKYQSNFSS